MAEDEEMEDLSQALTQSGSIQFSQAASQPEAWGRLNVFSITKKRLGVRSSVINFSYNFVKSVELFKEKTTFGRCAEFRIADFNVVTTNKLDEISKLHFSIVKNDVTDALCPVFLEDSSSNGSFVYVSKDRTDYGRMQPLNSDVKRRILANKDRFFIEKQPTIAFEYESYQRTLIDLPESINDAYHVGKVLGQGACGTVYLIRDRMTLKAFALKYTSSNDNEDNENRLYLVLKEIDILKHLKHPCVLQLHRQLTFPNAVAIFLDFMEGGDLLDRIQHQERKCFDEGMTKFFFYQICQGLDYMHSMKVTHRDLKPDNILLATTDKYTLVKISDFGLSKLVKTGTPLTTQWGTRRYLAPEVQNSQQYTNKVDVWSAGVVLYNCFCGRYPFRDDNVLKALSFTESQWKEASEDAKDVIREMCGTTHSELAFTER